MVWLYEVDHWSEGGEVLFTPLYGLKMACGSKVIGHMRNLLSITVGIPIF